MPTDVGLAVIADESSRFVVGTFPAARGLDKFLWGAEQVDRSAEPIEGWDFDGNAGVLRVMAAAGSATPGAQVPLASLVNLTWGGVNESRVADEWCHYEVRLFFDDNGRSTFVNLPGSADCRCASSEQARRLASRLREFLKPLCPRLEASTLEELAKFWRDPAAGLRSIQQRVETRLAALDHISPPSATPDPGLAEPGPTADPSAPAREMLTQLHAALGKLSEAAAGQQRQRAESGGQPAGGCARLIFALLIVGLGFGIGWWLMGK
jgi:hypothetical protein